MTDGVLCQKLAFTLLPDCSTAQRHEGQRAKAISDSQNVRLQNSFHLSAWKILQSKAETAPISAKVVKKVNAYICPPRVYGIK